MPGYWQLSGPQGHIHRDWRDKDTNEIVSETIFSRFATKNEEGVKWLELILGVKDTGETQILIPYGWRADVDVKRESRYAQSHRISWKHKIPEYLDTDFASLSPIEVDTPQRLEALLDQRQNRQKNTKAARARKDTSVANGSFVDGPPRPLRSSFEHGRCLWRLMRGHLDPHLYGLPATPWVKHIKILSLAFKFWRPGGTMGAGASENPVLLSAAVTEFELSQNEDQVPGKTSYYIVEESIGLQNPDDIPSEECEIPGSWQTQTVHQSEVAQVIVNHLPMIEGKLVTPVLLLLHDCDHYLLEKLGLRPSEWILGVEKLLRPPKHSSRNVKKEEEDTKPQQRIRSRSRSPGRDTKKFKRSHSPEPYCAPAIYWVDVLDYFRTVTSYQPHPKERHPARIYHKLTGHKQVDSGNAGHDSIYILQSWKKMVEGPSLVDQNAFYEVNGMDAQPPPVIAPEAHNPEAPEAPGLHEPMQANYIDPFNDGSDDSYDDS